MPQSIRALVAPALLAAALVMAAGPLRAADLDLARDLLARGEAERALAVAESALLRQPAEVPLQFVRGVALMDLRRDDEAMAQFERLTQQYPELPEPYNNIALLHARAARLEPARQALEAALRNDPGHRAARANLGLVHLMLARQHWELLAAGSAIDPALARRLEAVRALLSTAPR